MLLWLSPLTTENPQDHVDQDRQYNTQDKTGDNWEIEGAPIASQSYIAWQPSEKRDVPQHHQQNPCYGENDRSDQQEFAHIAQIEWGHLSTSWFLTC
jgi:hypothetical protein